MREEQKTPKDKHQKTSITRFTHGVASGVAEKCRVNGLHSYIKETFFLVTERSNLDMMLVDTTLDTLAFLFCVVSERYRMFVSVHPMTVRAAVIPIACVNILHLRLLLPWSRKQWHTQDIAEPALSPVIMPNIPVQKGHATSNNGDS